MRRERGRRAGGAWVRRTRSDGRAPRSCVRSARFVSSAIRVGIPEADWADLGAAAELTPSGARDARSGRRTSCPVDLAVQQSDDPLAGESSTRHGSAQRLATVPLHGKQVSASLLPFRGGRSGAGSFRAPADARSSSQAGAGRRCPRCPQRAAADALLDCGSQRPARRLRRQSQRFAVEALLQPHASTTSGATRCPSGMRLSAAVVSHAKCATSARLGAVECAPRPRHERRASSPRHRSRRSSPP